MYYVKDVMKIYDYDLSNRENYDRAVEMGVYKGLFHNYVKMVTRANTPKYVQQISWDEWEQRMLNEEIARKKTTDQ